MCSSDLIGNVNMTFCGVAANHNGNENLDYVYSGSQLVTPMSGTLAAEVGDAKSFSVYPNPANDVFYISTGFQDSDPTIVRIFDLSGKQIEELNVTGNQDYPVNVSKYQKGIYYLSAVNGDQSYTQKIKIGRAHV